MDKGIFVSHPHPGNRSLSKAEPSTEILLSPLYNITDQHTQWRQNLGQV